jgi:hypothetical protein
MKEFTKTYEYKGHTFITNVKLDTTVERRIGGARFHTVSTFSYTEYNKGKLIGFFTSDNEVTTETLNNKIEDQYNSAKLYADGVYIPPNDSITEILLKELGFTLTSKNVKI